MSKKTIEHTIKKLKSWVARDEDGKLFLYQDKPIKFAGKWVQTQMKFHFRILDEEMFPEVKWEDEEPKELTFTFKK